MNNNGFTVAVEADRFDAPLWLGQSRNVVKVSAADTGDGLAIFEYRYAALGGPPLHVHPEQDEIFFILEGRYDFRVGDADHRLGPGETIFLPRGVPHTFAQVSENGRLLYMFNPAGDMEAFFAELATVDPAVVTAASIASVFARHGMRVVGPPLPIG